MKYQEWKETNNLKTAEDVRLLLQANKRSGKLPVAIVVCPRCDEVLDDYSKPCPACERLK